jgi:hypothetical protein
MSESAVASFQRSLHIACLAEVSQIKHTTGNTPGKHMTIGQCCSEADSADGWYEGSFYRSRTVVTTVRYLDFYRRISVWSQFPEIPYVVLGTKRANGRSGWHAIFQMCTQCKHLQHIMDNNGCAKRHSEQLYTACKAWRGSRFDRKTNSQWIGARDTTDGRYIILHIHVMNRKLLHARNIACCKSVCIPTSIFCRSVTNGCDHVAKTGTTDFIPRRGVKQSICIIYNRSPLTWFVPMRRYECTRKFVFLYYTGYSLAPHKHGPIQSFSSVSCFIQVLHTQKQKLSDRQTKNFENKRVILNSSFSFQGD